ncbi:Monoamine oxidase N [Cercospora beticola]|uniref:monoamine oxidase n=1 Tax=Cercospora beticola TaxID=122368 RepID=A0A2G5HMT1_CERBT|nr:Monoamine oxidase N [Cercospora beticola]PIA93864.1 Monoamine oxidase N [Cercospora beticola]WPB02341.1 hypothetical protein RHO25_006975 [Cercospora beticola]
MAPYQANLSHDGYTYTKIEGLTKGLHTYCVIKPQRKIHEGSKDQLWEAIVIGSGYAGLVAARDLVKAGKRTLLLEGRDRVGGRTWSAEVDGTTFEMGGTWISHVHGRLWAELQRYGLKDEVSMTRTQGGGASYFTLDTGSGSRKLSLEEAGAMTNRAWKILVNYDGNDGRDICPLPYSTLGNLRVSPEEVKKVDQLSCQDRIEQVRHLLTPDEIALIESLVPHMAGGTPANVGFLELLRSQSLQGFTPETFEEFWTLYKVKAGQSSLARAIFDDAVGLGLQYAFQHGVTKVVDRNGTVSLTTEGGEVFRAQRVVNTMPLHVLPTVEFDPPLSMLRREAIQIGHQNYLTKIHAIAEGDLRGLRGCTWPGDFLYVYGDGFCADGKSTRITSFAGDNRGILDPLKEPERLEVALKRFHPMEIRKVIFHDWTSDRYSLGGPAWYRAGFLTKYLAELQSPHGNVLMANADWASGWRAFIEGAMEQGGLAADSVMRQLGVRGANEAYEPKL